jgi:murein DD-endopeptidase MepM/ murein hydrolase activator NlpD
VKFWKTLTGWLTSRYQLVVRSEGDFAEKFTLRFSYSALLALISFSLLLFTGLGLLLANSLLRSWLNPSYVAQRTENKVEALCTAVEGLEQQHAEQERWIQNLQQALGTSVDDTMQQRTDQPFGTGHQLTPPPLEVEEEEHHEVSTATSASPRSSLAPAEGASHVSSLATTVYQSTSPLPYLSFVPPLEGRITTRFDLEIGHYGLDIVGREQAPVKAIASGRVILATWAVEVGWLIVLQHEHGLLSVYKHNAILFKQEGHAVKAGEVIGLMGNTGDFSTGPHLHFELWHHGYPLNPEDFIAF